MDKILNGASTEDLDREFNQGNYTFRYEFTDKDGNRRFQISQINDNVPKNEALKMIGQHISEYENGRLTDFVENDWIKSKFHSRDQQIRSEERERVLREMEEFLKYQAESIEGIVEDINGCAEWKEHPLAQGIKITAQQSAFSIRTKLKEI